MIISTFYEKRSHGSMSYGLGVMKLVVLTSYYLVIKGSKILKFKVQ